MADTSETPTPAVDETESAGSGGDAGDLTLGAASSQVWVDQTEEAQPEGEAPASEEGKEKPGEPTGAADEGKGEGGESPTPEGSGEAAQQGATGEEPPEPAPSGAASETPGESDEGAAQPPPESKTEPFSFAVDGTKVDVPGAVVGKAATEDGGERDYILIPKESWERVVQPRVADRVQIQQREAHLQRELEKVRREMNPEHHPDVQRARAFSKEFDKVLESKESLTAFLTNFEQSRAHIKDRVENAVLLAEREGREAVSEAEANEQQIETWANQMATDLPNVVASVLEDDRVKPRLTPEAAQVFRRRVLRNAGRYYTIGTEETEQAGGLRKGQLGRNDDLIVQELQDVLELAPSSGNGSGEKKPKQDPAKIAEQNAQVLGGGKKPPVTPSPKASATPTNASDEIPRFKSKEELMAWAHE